MRLPTKKLFCENTSPFIKALILKKRAGIPLTRSEEKEYEFEIWKETVSMTEPTKYHHRLASLPQPISEPYKEELEDNDTLSKEELETLIRNIVLGIIDEEDDLNEIIENLTKNP